MPDPRACRHAYLGYLDGVCVMARLDMADPQTAADVSAIIMHGGHVERVPFDVARQRFALTDPADKAP